ncbi:hypothetical protein J6590_008733 [Homalodisca vitripennis]|nr:hypothetical protein J6590_008733 [Homalodisca vitripennis]
MDKNGALPQEHMSTRQRSRQRDKFKATDKILTAMGAYSGGSIVQGLGDCHRQTQPVVQSNRKTLPEEQSAVERNNRDFRSYLNGTPFTT